MARLVTHPKRTARQERARARQALSDKLTIQEKIDKQVAGHHLGKELARLIRRRDLVVNVNSLPEGEADVQPKRLTSEEKAVRKAEYKAAAKQVK